MVVIDSLQELRRWRAGATDVGLVPTMGCLHEGHLSLVRRAREECGQVVVTLFVNPTQFGPNEDFAQYPRNLERDRTLCEQEGADVLFAPDASEIYPPGDQTRVIPGDLASGLCGAHRPGHFQGVLTVVLKLFNLAQPDKAFFGLKDYQQYRAIQQMASDFFLSVEVVGCPIVREPDGLAMSSRNIYLSAEERMAALSLSGAIFRAQAACADGERGAEKLRQIALSRIQEEPLVKLQYLEIVDPDTLQPIGGIEEKGLIALAAHVGKTRLIDNGFIIP
ncbi:MAG: pantoate--beta-alanine ligase [Armatimonadetes bacterium]|nr:pantoate--beta-alanine ligase [Armatimonadota bacterium]